MIVGALPRIAGIPSKSMYSPDCHGRGVAVQRRWHHVAMIGWTGGYPWWMPLAEPSGAPLNRIDIGRWRIRIDTGGTFTDCLALPPTASAPRRVKVLSSGRVRARFDGARLQGPGWLSRFEGVPVLRVRDGATAGTLGSGRMLQMERADACHPGEVVECVPGLDAPLLAMHVITGTRPNDPLPPIDLRIATTRGTNALLERRTGRVLLVTTAGFEDLVTIGDQDRPDLFALDVRPARLLPAAVIGIDARMAADGRVLSPLDVDAAIAEIRRVIDAAAEPFDAVAICLLHAWRDPRHERELEQAILRFLPDTRISVSHRISPDIRIVPRIRTVVADAALSPALHAFLENLGLEDGRDRVLAMSSGGGLIDRSTYRPCESLLSGPAAGMVGAIAAAARAGMDRLVAFDMGGTSTDVGRARGRADLRDATSVGDATVRVPSVDLHTIAAGGGSICRVVDGRLEVGPESAGASPGPACYGGGGPLTLTDVNLLLGRADPDRFGVPLHLAAAEAALEREVVASGRVRTDLLEGFVALADERMAEAIRIVTTRRGEDPADHVLVAFGGAGGQHACGVAARLGMKRVLIPADAGLLSAVGLHVAARERSVESAVLEPLPAFDLESTLDRLGAEAIESAEAAEVTAPVVRRIQIRTRLLGQDTTIDLEYETILEVQSSVVERDFRSSYRRLYGHLPPPRPIEIAGIRMFAGDAAGNPLPDPDGADARSSDRAKGSLAVDRASLPVETDLHGPLLVADPTSTILVPEGWSARADEFGGLMLHRRDSGTTGIAGAASSEIMACRLESIAREMGETLRRTALSVNVKERLDYSCGIVDAAGRLVVNAPHMPVHLGAMGDCVRAVVSRIDLGPGDVALVNHPGFGGSHLPDLTVVSPVFGEAEECIGYVVNRAHHAEIGGTRPGSMPPDATCLVEEGVVIPPMKIVIAGVPAFDAFEEMLRRAPHPSRAVADNLADLAAQLASNELGVRRLAALWREVGPADFDRDLEGLRRRCSAAIERLIESRPGFDRSVEERLDDGTPIRLRVAVEDGRMSIDFTGSGNVHPRNLNAPFAVVRAATLYVLRVVAAEAIPLNEGALERVDLICPEGFLAPPFRGDAESDPAVAIGNTETSQRVVDALLRCFGVVAGSQGTMNNLLLGNDRFGYYETICGGTGAGPDFDGCDAVHSHMTNTRLTDPEVFEHRYPVRLESFSIRRGSGGEGRHRGGDGVVRTIRAIESLQGSLLGQHRVERPYGLQGGAPGTAAIARVERADGSVEVLPGIAAFDLGPEDRLRIETPGGGGYGLPTDA